jgi:hypothetical protein
MQMEDEQRVMTDDSRLPSEKQAGLTFVDCHVDEPACSPGRVQRPPDHCGRLPNKRVHCPVCGRPGIDI